MRGCSCTVGRAGLVYGTSAGQEPVAGHSMQAAWVAELVAAAGDVRREDPQLRRRLQHPQVFLAVADRHPIEVGLSLVVWAAALHRPEWFSSFNRDGRIALDRDAWLAALLGLDRKTTLRWVDLARVVGREASRGYHSDDGGRTPIEMVEAVLDAGAPPVATAALVETVATRPGSRPRPDTFYGQILALLDRRGDPLAAVERRLYAQRTDSAWPRRQVPLVPGWSLVAAAAVMGVLDREAAELVVTLVGEWGSDLQALVGSVSRLSAAS